MSMGDRSCTIEGCDRQNHAQGFCARHYRRFRKYGDPHMVGRRGRRPGARPTRGRATVLTAEDVEVINERLQNGEKGAAIARDFAVSQQSISSIKTGETWNWLTGNRKESS